MTSSAEQADGTRRRGMSFVTWRGLGCRRGLRRVVVLGDLFDDGVEVSPAHDGVDQAVTSASGEVVFSKAETPKVVRVVG